MKRRKLYASVFAMLFSIWGIQFIFAGGDSPLESLFGLAQDSDVPTDSAPEPTQNSEDVINIFSDAYTNSATIT